MLKKVLLIALLFIQGCSVYMAAEGKKTPNISGFHDGMTRFQVESVLGGPVDYRKIKDGSTAVYEFTVGDEPDSGRAALWLVADLLLVFLPELIGTPIEANRGETKRIQVTYNTDDIVTKLEI